MSDQTDNLSSLLEPFGLSHDDSRLYLYLLQNGHNSALQISRGLHIARTRVYRILDILYENGLVNRKMEKTGFTFGANSYTQLEILLTKREQEVERLKKTTPAIFEQLKHLVPSSNDNSKVLYFTGLEGLKHITLNSLNADKNLYIYEMQQDMTAFADPDFSEEVRLQLVENTITTFQLTNLTRLKPHTKVTTLVERFWEIRHVDPKELSIDFEVLIYNDVYCLYTYKNKEFFCVEIHNEHLAHMQKKLFEFVWKRSNPMKKLDEFGSATI